MEKIGFKFPKTVRNTALLAAEEWYQKLLAKKLNKDYAPIKRSNFGEYSMAVNYMTSVLEESRAVEKVAIYNIDHMAQIEVSGKDAVDLLDRIFPIKIDEMKVGQDKYTLLLTEEGTVIDDMIIMRMSSDRFIIVINAGHDITDKGISHGEEVELIADADHIGKHVKDGEDVKIIDLSDKLVKIDVQGPLSYKLVTKLYGDKVVKNRNKPKKNMRYFTFNEFDFEGQHYIISRTGYTNRWGWEMYIPVEVAEEQFKRIATEALELGGLVVGLGGRDENRISAGNMGLPLNGSEYDPHHTPINAPLFKAAVDMDKKDFIGKSVFEKEFASNPQKRMVLFITEGIVTGRVIYKDGKMIGSVTSSINSPNVSFEKRRFIGSKRKNVNAENGTAAIGLGWVYENLLEVDEEGNDIFIKDGEPVRINLDFYRLDKEGNPKGKVAKGYLSGDGVTSATSFKPLRKIQKL
ncbi:MAG: aminomethyltransferase family protein [Candidatus Cloacimonadota bacterium]|nr:aminomethyltransferase family protein [Candidatus Cloacimonadota bacterium]